MTIPGVKWQNLWRLVQAGAAGFFLLPICFAAETAAAPLDKDACAKLAHEMENLKELQVGKLMEKGPEWAVSHLSQGDLSLVRRYIDTDEQIKFRCSNPASLVHLSHVEDDDEEMPAPKQADTGKAAKAANDAAPDDTAASTQPKQKAAKTQKKTKPDLHANSNDNR
jgi:hypothetical protein